MPAYLRYAFYLACSWLWCIGAFLPLILLRDYGTVSLWVFTLVNVGGAAAFGFYFTRSRQQRFLQAHRPALNLFSYITIAYQVFFVAWLGTEIGQPWWLAGMLALAALFYRADGTITALATGVYVISLVLMGWFGLEQAELSHRYLISADPQWLHVAAPLALGFIFSPYLDITFHRAFAQSERPRLAFALGFGVFFLSLLAFVYLYAAELAGLFFAGRGLLPVLYPVIAFITLQTAFTIAAHARENRRYNSAAALPLWGAIVGGAALAMLSLQYAHELTLPGIGLPLAEGIYKGFLFFYGLVFPLYLLLGKRRAWLVALLCLTAPLYSVGFLIGTEYTYLLSVAMLLVALASLRLSAFR